MTPRRQTRRAPRLPLAANVVTSIEPSVDPSHYAHWGWPIHVTVTADAIKRRATNSIEPPTPPRSADTAERTLTPAHVTMTADAIKRRATNSNEPPTPPRSADTAEHRPIRDRRSSTDSNAATSGQPARGVSNP